MHSFCDELLQGSPPIEALLITLSRLLLLILLRCEVLLRLLRLDSENASLRLRLFDILRFEDVRDRRDDFRRSL
jgi:hypothetical protein